MSVPDSSSTRPVRVLQVVGAMNRGGVETWLLHVLRHIDRRRVEIDVLVHTEEPGAYDAEVEALGAHIIRVPWTTRPWTYPRDFLRAVRRFGPYDVIHTNMYLFDALPLSLGAAAGIRGRIAHIHTSEDIKRGSAFRSLYRRTSRLVISRTARVILGASAAGLHSFMQSLRRVHPETRVLYCGLDLQRFRAPVDREAVRRRLGLPVGRPVVVYVARFVHPKNQEQMVRVADVLRAQGCRYHFVMVGAHGPELERFLEIAAGRDDLTVLTKLEHPAEVLGACDVFFFPSMAEGLGLVAVEAQAAGLPVVASDLPTIREATAPPLHTLMFPINDDLQAAHQLRRVVEDSDLQVELSRIGREWAERFTIERCLEGLVPLYERLAWGA